MSKSKKNAKSSPVTTMVPNEEGQLEVVEQTNPLSTLQPNEEGVLVPKTKRRGGKRELNEEDPFLKQTISLQRKENPKRKGSKSARRFDLYRDGMTVLEFIKAGGTRGDINWDTAHEHIVLIPASGLAVDLKVDAETNE